MFAQEVKRTFLSLTDQPVIHNIIFFVDNDYTIIFLQV